MSLKGPSNNGCGLFFLYICDYNAVMTFTEKVYEVVRKIPAGKTITYKEVAKRAGSPSAYRAVGNILSKNFDLKIPCHRVIGSDGKMHGYNRGGIKEKLKILKREKGQ